MKKGILVDLARKLFLRFPRNHAAVAGICVILTLLVGLLDYATGYEIDFFLFYFLPIAISAWFAGRSTTTVIVLLSVATWLAADILSNHLPSSWLVEEWNTFIQGSTFLITAFIVSYVRNTLDREQQLNRDLSETLAKLEVEIQERKQLEEALRASVERIKFFAYSVSHDLKSPLIGINGLTRLLHHQYGDSLDEKGRRICDQIMKASAQVLNLIEEINVYIKAKEAPLELENVNPKEILAIVRDEFDARLNAGNIAWKETESIPNIKAHRLSMLRIFRNLVDNALKYGGEELNEITVGYEESDEWHIFSVTDNGVGIRGEDCEKVFELFQRHSSSKDVEGTGLGLAIVKAIAAKHKGEVWAESGDTRGVVFYVSISKNL